jgi:hypothetical protein
MQIPNPIEYFNNRLKKCRVDEGVYKDVNDIDDDDYKKYALFKIIELITNASVITYGHEKKYDLMKNLKKITYKCNPIIEKIFFDLLPEYKLLSNMEESKYYKLKIEIAGEAANNTYHTFFKKHELLQYVYDEKDPNKNYIFKVNSADNSTITLLVQNDNQTGNVSIQSIENKFDKTAENPVEKEDIGNTIFNLVIDISTSRHETKIIIKNITEILINNKEIADEYNKNKNKNIAEEQYGGIGKKQKVKSKPFKNKMLQNKEIFGKEMRIYKINGSKKEHVKYKGTFIPVSDYKMLIKKKNS